MQEIKHGSNTAQPQNPLTLMPGLKGGQLQTFCLQPGLESPGTKESGSERHGILTQVQRLRRIRRSQRLQKDWTILGEAWEAAIVGP